MGSERILPSTRRGNVASMLHFLRGMRIPLALAVLLTAHVAHTDVTRCAASDIDVRYQHALFDEITGDTGWFPQGYDAQLRLTGRIAGETKVSMGLRPT